ncbi:hypothetical protein EVA_11726 [gut metagenome]|uniref:Uncharacterized protein n=1 Tax=gut metagenome TaxID=749906 RepID=J9GKG9_9ZZZZ
MVLGLLPERLQPVSKNAVDVIAGAAFGNRLFHIVDVVGHSHGVGFRGRDPVVLPVEVGRLHLFLVAVGAVGDDFPDGILQALQLPDHVAQVLLVAVASAAHVVQHDACVSAHLHPPAAEGDDTGNAGGNPVDVDGHVALAAADGVEDGNARIDFPSHGIDVYLDMGIHRFQVVELVHELPARNAALIPFVAHLPVQQDAYSIVVQYRFEYVHFAIFYVLAGFPGAKLQRVCKPGKKVCNLSAQVGRHYPVFPHSPRNSLILNP